MPLEKILIHLSTQPTNSFVRNNSTIQIFNQQEHIVHHLKRLLAFSHTQQSTLT